MRPSTPALCISRYRGLSPVKVTRKQSGIDRTYATPYPSLVRLHMTFLLRRDRTRGVHSQLHNRLMTAFWGEDRDISDPDVLAEEGVAAGLDPDEVRDAATTHSYQDRIEASTAAVMQMGAGGVPAFVVDDRVLIPG